MKKILLISFGVTNFLLAAMAFPTPTHAATCAISSTATLNQAYIDSNSCDTINVSGTFTLTVSGNLDLVGDGSLNVTSGTVTLSGAVVLGSTDDFNVSLGATITHAQGDTTGVSIAAENMNVAGAISALGKGCQGGVLGSANGYGPNTSTGICAQTTSGYGILYRGGAAHAGTGGAGNGGTTQTTTYGSSTAPVLLGSGAAGGQNSGENGGAGGGKIRLDVSGTLTVSGSLSVNGASGTGAGGGSGGSLYVTAGTLAGGGTMTAAGGNGATYGGGGGGGRVAVYYNTLSGFTLGNITAAKGTKGGSGSPVDGSAGSTFLLNRKIDDGSGDLAITSGMTFQNGVDFLRTNITVYSGSELTCETFATLNIGASETLNFQGTTWTCSTIDVVNISAGTWLTSGTNVVTINKTGAQVDWDITNDFTLNNFSYTGASVGTTSANGGLLTMDNAVDVALVNSNIVSNVSWTGLSSLNIDASSSVSALGKGCQGGVQGSANGYGPNTSTGICAQTTSGYGIFYRGGAAHAGTGGAGNGGTTQTTTYGSSTAPVLLGSGAAGGQNSGENGGAGGGKIRLDVSGTLTVSGSLSVNGASGTGAGGGSGGSLYVTAGTLAGGGTMTAAGGNGFVWGGGGGGGRVAVYYNALSGFTLGNITAAKGTKGGSGSPVDGSVGSLTIVQTVALASMVITDTSGYTNDATPLITTVSVGATPTHIAFSCNGGSDWSSWLTYPDDNVSNDDDGPVFNLTSDATGCSAANELKTIKAKIKDSSSESSSVSDSTTYDTAAPTVSSVSSSNANGAYDVGEVLTITVQFSEPTMAVTGNPQIELAMDGTDRQAAYASTSTTTLSFTYTVASGDNASDLDYTSTSALALNGGTITDAAGNSAVLTLATPGAANSLSANKNITVSTNQSPTVSSVTFSQGSDGTGDVTVTFIVDDPDDDNTLQAKVEYSLNGGSSWADPTLSAVDGETTATYGDPDVDNAQTYQIGQSGGYISTSSGANTVTIIWEAATDAPALTDISNAKIRITPYDGTVTGSALASSNAILDFVAPTGLASITHGNASAQNVRISWDAVTDGHFSHYELWYASIDTDAQNRTGGATEWDDSDDALLATISTTSSVVSGNLQNKYAVLFAVDDYGNSISSGVPLRIQPPHSKVGPQTSQTTPVSYGVTISAPSVNSTYVTGENLSISWGQTGSYASFVDIYYSLDGTLYIPIARNQNAATASYTWAIPASVYGEQVTIRIDLTDLLTVLATNSSEAFSITSESVDPAESTDSQSGSSDSHPTGTYIRGESWPTVYYIDGQVRRPFLDSQTYFTYESDFSRVVTVADSLLSLYSLGGPMLPKPGSILLKVQSVPRVYITDSSGALHWITTEEIANALFGNSWAEYVIDVPVTAWPHFTFGDEITSADSLSVDTTLLKTRQEVSR